jgi:hypothetical protein
MKNAEFQFKIPQIDKIKFTERKWLSPLNLAFVIGSVYTVCKPT